MKAPTRLAGIVTAASLAACASPDAERRAATGSPVTEAKAAASGQEPEAAPPRESSARTVDAYKRDAARRIYFRNTSLIYDGAPPPALKSLVILSIRLDAEGTPTRVAVVRSNGFRDLERRAIQSVHDAAPLPVPRSALLSKGVVEYYETWLFRSDDRFQIRSLAEVQQSIGE